MGTGLEKSLRVVALYEAAKGALVLMAGCGLLALLGRDLEKIAVSLVHRLHLNPASHYPRVFIDAMAHVTNAQLWLMAAGAVFYAILRGAEAYGLWFNRVWASWLGVISGALYLPLEAYEILEKPSTLHISIFVINLIMVGLLVFNLWRERKKNDRVR